jgi:hypothetical protein
MTKSSLEHSPEPWRYHYNGNISTKHEIIAQGLRFPNAERIVACINACAGIPTEMIKHIVYVGLITLNDSATTPEQWLTKALEMREKE